MLSVCALSMYRFRVKRSAFVRLTFSDCNEKLVMRATIMEDKVDGVKLAAS